MILKNIISETFDIYMFHNIISNLVEYIRSKDFVVLFTNFLIQTEKTLQFSLLLFVIHV